MFLSLKSAPGWLDILICHQCKAKLLSPSEYELLCSKCGLTFPLRNNIPVMIPVPKDSPQRQLFGKETSELAPWFERRDEIDTYHRGKRDAAWCARLFIRDDEFLSASSHPQGEKTFFVEIGPGPIPRLTWFEATIRVGIDALAEHYDSAFGDPPCPINFLSAHTEAIPLANESVDALLCVNALDHVGNMSLTLSELWRILKPNGLFFLGVLYDSSPLSCEEPHVVDREFLEKELYPNFIVEREALDSISKEEPPLGWYRVRLRKGTAPAYIHRFTPTQHARIDEFFHHFTEGMFLDTQGRSPEARESFQKALRYPGYYASDRYRLAYCAWRVAETAPALAQAVERTRERHLKHVLLEAAYKIGSSHKRQGACDKSLALFSNLLELAKPLGFKQLCGGAHFHMGEMYLRKGEKEKANNHFRKTLASIPDHQKAKLYLKN
ncbi:MAG: hypothetical protein A2Z34_02755 [Planctomycetes bacterium RBG_16_59_8]|nr:MAG: hypothetical protein A2Z34_02755 [Planctomycetes bacterium RBG_16_59_8]